MNSAHDPAVQEHSGPIKQTKIGIRAQKTLLISVIIGCGLLALGSLVINGTSKTLLPPSTASLPYAPLVPNSLPEGYTVDTSSYTVSGDILSYRATGDFGPFVFLQQPRSPSFSLSTLGTQGITGIKSANTNIGPAITGTLNGKTVAIVANDKIQLNITAPAEQDRTIMLKIVNGMVPGRR